MRELNLSTLEERSHQADMAMVHKIVHRRSGLVPETWFEMAGARRNTRSTGDPLNIVAYWPPRSEEKFLLDPSNRELERDPA